MCYCDRQNQKLVVLTVLLCIDKKVFPNLDPVGWYSNAIKVGSSCLSLGIQKRLPVVRLYALLSRTRRR